MRTGLYVILDLIADEIVGPPMTHKHDAVAIRMFSDIVAADGTGPHTHPDDYALIKLGYIEDPANREIGDTITLRTDYRQIMTGREVIAAQNQKLEIA